VDKNKVFEEFYLTIKAVLKASESILEIYRSDFDKMIKTDGSPVTIADLTSSKIINDILKETQIPVLGEEKVKEPYIVRKHWEKMWCVDPLDGTKEFIKKNGEFVINIALIENNKPVYGIIASPVHQKIILGGKEFGAYHISYENALFPEKWEKLPVLSEKIETVYMISSRSHFSGNLKNLSDTLEDKYGPVKSIVMGSALKFFDLVMGDAHIYPRFAPTMEWDIAAGQAIFEAVGGKVIEVETGNPLTYNKEDLENPYFIGVNPSISLSLEFYH